MLIYPDSRASRIWGQAKSQGKGAGLKIWVLRNGPVDPTLTKLGETVGDNGTVWGRGACLGEKVRKQASFELTIRDLSGSAK